MISGWDETERVNSDERTDRQNAWLFASISNQDDAWWYRLISETGSDGLRHFDAGELISLGMAEKIEAYQTRMNETGAGNISAKLAAVAV
jgi:hypothetical protein